MYFFPLPACLFLLLFLFLFAELALLMPKQEPGIFPLTGTLPGLIDFKILRLQPESLVAKPWTFLWSPLVYFQCAPRWSQI